MTQPLPELASFRGDDDPRLVAATLACSACLSGEVDWALDVDGWEAQVWCSCRSCGHRTGGGPELPAGAAPVPARQARGLPLRLSLAGVSRPTFVQTLKGRARPVDTAFMLRPHGWGQRLRRSARSPVLSPLPGLRSEALPWAPPPTEAPTISTVAGDGSVGYAGDGGPAANASLNAPESVAALPDGSFLIADKENSRVRRVSPDGTIATVAGSGTAGYDRDGVPAVSGQSSTARRGSRLCPMAAS